MLSGGDDSHTQENKEPFSPYKIGICGILGSNSSARISAATKATLALRNPRLLISAVVRGVVGYFENVSTSFVERHNWTARGTMRRYTRLSNGFSRKLENHAAAVALNYLAYNFIKIHRTLRVSPAMAAGVVDRLWSVVDLVALWESYEQRRAERVA